MANDIHRSVYWSTMLVIKYAAANSTGEGGATFSQFLMKGMRKFFFGLSARYGI